MKKVLPIAAAALLVTGVVNAQDKSGNAARDAKYAKETSIKEAKETKTREVNREPAMGRADQRGRVNEGLRQWKKDLDEAGKTQGGGEKKDPEPKPSPSTQQEKTRPGDRASSKS